MTVPLRSSHRALSVLVALAVLLLVPRALHADEIDRCKSAAEEGEDQRARSRLRSARERLLVCARDVCPRVIRDACIVSVLEIDKILPTIVVRARDARGQDVLGVRVLLDGTPLADRLTGIGLPLDPGPHRLRYEAAGGDAKEETLLVAQGERDRLVRITFDVALSSDGRRVAVARAGTPALPGETTPSLLPLAVTAGVGLAGVGAFTVLELQGWSDYRALKNEPCAATGTCDVSGVRTRLIAGDVALGVGVLSLGVAAVLAILHFGHPPHAVSATAPVVLWRPEPRSGFAGFRSSF